MPTQNPNEPSFSAPQLLIDRVKHAAVFAQATVRALDEALDVLDELVEIELLRSLPPTEPPTGRKRPG
jgi:hypothetical protein